MRNPNFRFGAILRYDAAGHEEGVRPEMESYVSELENAFLKSSLVAQHFENPRVSWDAAMRLNDGGIQYIREKLQPLCNPQLKEAQLAQSMREQCLLLNRRLSVFFRSNDTTALFEKKRKFIRVLFTRFGELEQKYQRMGLLLKSFTIRDAEIYDMYTEAYRRFLEKPEEENETSLSLDLLDVSNTNMDDWNPFVGADSAQEAKENALDTSDEASFYADYIESMWIARLHNEADDVGMQKFFHMTSQEFSDLVSELATGCSRLRIRDAMLEDFRKAAAYANTQKESIRWQQASMAAHRINSFVCWLGMDPSQTSAAERTVERRGKSVVLFEKKPSNTGLAAMTEQRSPYANEYLGDWLTALSALLIGNVTFDGEQQINIEENAKLGEFLSLLDTCAQ